MAHLFQNDKVKYLCTCGSLKPISRIYFCRHCLKLRCGYCVSHEVDSHYCPTCLENMPSAEARLKKNRCANCFDCPSCQHTLSTRATSLAVPSSEDPSKMIPKKVYYLACGFCRWTSRDIQLPDQSVATGGWPERENEQAGRIALLLDHYRTIAQREKQEKERRKFVPRRSYLQFSDKFGGLSAVMARKRAGLPPMAGLLKDDNGTQHELSPAVASEEVEQLPEDIFTAPVDLHTSTTLHQRLSQVDVQPVDVKGLFPLHKQLLVKRSQRCRHCEHNLSKPEYNPASIKFKIQLSAYYHLPDVRIWRCGSLSAASEIELVLKLSNPTTNQMTVTLFNLPSAEEEEKEEEEEEKNKKKKEDGGQGEHLASLISVGHQALPLESTPRPHFPRITAALKFPSSSIAVLLPPRDDAAEYDDSGEARSFSDDPQIVVWRKGNKAAVRLSVTPSETSGDVVAAFVLQYVYTCNVSLEHKEPQSTTLKTKIFLNLGSLA